MLLQYRGVRCLAFPFLFLRISHIKCARNRVLLFYQLIFSQPTSQSFACKSRQIKSKKRNSSSGSKRQIQLATLVLCVKTETVKRSNSKRSGHYHHHQHCFENGQHFFFYTRSSLFLDTTTTTTDYGK